RRRHLRDRRLRRGALGRRTQCPAARASRAPAILAPGHDAAALAQPYRYRDFGSLVSLGHYDTIGQLMGFVASEKFRVEGYLAKLFYISLYRQHLWALHGFWRMALDTLARMIRRQVEPKVKLH